MSQPAIFWTITAVVLLVIFIADAVSTRRRHSRAHRAAAEVAHPHRRHAAHHPGFIRFGSERDIFYIPGDYNHDKLPEELD